MVVYDRAGDENASVPSILLRGLACSVEFGLRAKSLNDKSSF